MSSTIEPANTRIPNRRQIAKMRRFSLIASGAPIARAEEIGKKPTQPPNAIRSTKKIMKIILSPIKPYLQPLESALVVVVIIEPVNPAPGPHVPLSIQMLLTLS
jgi:hypothetical protein